MQVKGRMFKTSLDFVSQKFGCHKLDDFLILNPEFAEMHEYLELDWYPIEKLIKLLEKIDSHFGYSDLAIIEEMGKYAAKTAFEGSHRIIKDLNPKTLFANANMIASSFYSTAKVRTEFIKDTCVKLYYNGFPESTYLSKRIFGWAKQGLLMSGGKNIRCSEFRTKDGLGFNFEWND